MRTITKLALAFGAGAVAMYFWDPATRRRQRWLARDHAIAAGLEAEAFAGIAPVDDTVVVSGDPLGDEQLHDLIRGRLELVAAMPEDIDVDVHYGHVVLSGIADADEIDDVIAVVASVPGVDEVIDELVSRRAASDQAPGAQAQTH